MERPLEAVDLYKEGWAPVVVLSPGRPEPSEGMLRERGIRFPSDVELERDALVQLGIPAAAIIATNGYVDNTAQEANLLRAMVLAHHWRRVIIVTSKYHTRRAGVRVPARPRGHGGRSGDARHALRLVGPGAMVAHPQRLAVRGERVAEARRLPPRTGRIHQARPRTANGDPVALAVFKVGGSRVKREG